MGTFKSEIAVVTGASSGIGKAIALGLAAQGAMLCLVGRKLETLEAVAKSARLTAAQVLSYQADLMRDEDIQGIAEYLQQKFGRVHTLIHSAGIISIGRFDCAPVEDLDLQYKINVRTPYTLTQALLPMLRSCQGQIVFINSSAGLSARAGVGQYAATKHALKAIADSLRDEVNADGLRVLSVYLGRTASSMQAVVHALENKVYQPEHLMQPEDVASVVINALNLPRTAEVTDISIRPLKKT
jgi:NADP-dependent 3-hydroxy acid dehydrogenase YdfG